MEIRFVSSLTAEDEELFAPAVLKAASALLDQLPIAYTLRIETAGAQVFQHTHVAPPSAAMASDPPGSADGLSTFNVRNGHRSDIIQAKRGVRGTS